MARGHEPCRGGARVDGAIGDRIRRRRIELGLTQDQLARRLGLSYQQIQKYEGGSNRISASRLYELAQRLDVTPSYFYLDLEVVDESTDGDGDLGSDGQVADAYGEIANEEVRSAVLGLVRAVVERQR